jgi:hypothetical protein
VTSSTHPQAILDQAQKLIDQGWDTNLVLGSVTRKRDQRTGLVDDSVWNAMKFLQAQQAWVRTAPQPITPSDSWGG